MGAKDSCKPFYEVLVDAVHEKKGSLDISLLSTHCRFDGVDANLADHTELAYRSVQGVNYRVYLWRKLYTRGEEFLTIKGIESVRKISLEKIEVRVELHSELDCMDHLFNSIRNTNS